MWIEGFPGNNPGQNDVNNYIRRFESSNEDFGQ